MTKHQAKPRHVSHRDILGGGPLKQMTGMIRARRYHQAIRSIAVRRMKNYDADMRAFIS